MRTLEARAAEERALMERLAKTLRTAREGEGMTVEDAATRSCVPVAQWREVEEGAPDIDMLTLARMAWGLGCGVGMLLEAELKWPVWLRKRRRILRG